MRSYPGKESATGEYTGIISLLGLCENLGYLVLGMHELVYPYYMCFLNPCPAYLNITKQNTCKRAFYEVSLVA